MRKVDFALAVRKGMIRVFTTRPDTLFGATYMVLAPEHPFVDVVRRATAEAAVTGLSRSNGQEKAICNGRNSTKKRPACSPAAMRSIR